MRGQSVPRKRFPIATKILTYGILACLLFVIFVYGWACCAIKSGVKAISIEAMQEYPGDRVEAPIEYVQSEDHNLKDRNRAVWALGNIADKRALPVLEQFYVGEPCKHDEYLCQRELKRAIDRCQGKLNLTAWVSR